MRKRVVSGFVVCTLVGGWLGAGTARADDLDDADFGLRFSMALGRFARYPDVAALGGAGGGSPWSSAPNPAASALNPSVGPRRLGVSAQWSGVWFDAGTQVDVLSLSGAFAPRGGGSWQPAVVRAESNRATTRDGLTFGWDVLGGELQWATRLPGGWAVGANASVLDSSIDFGAGPLTAVASNSTTWALRAGVLKRFSRCFCVGLALEGLAAPGHTTTFDVFGAGTGDVRTSDTTYGVTLRPGLYWLLTQDLSLYADYVFARYEDDTGSLTSHRFAGGLDLTIVRGVYARAGLILDHWGHTTWTAGIGIAPSERFLIDLSFQDNAFPEIEREFGRGQTFALGITLTF